MKNPWMSMWLSAAKRRPEPHVGFERQSCTGNRGPWPKRPRALGFGPSTSKKPTPAKRGRKPAS